MLSHPRIIDSSLQHYPNGIGQKRHGEMPLSLLATRWPYTRDGQPVDNKKQQHVG